MNYHELTERALLEHYAQSALLVNGRGEIVHVYGRTGKFLELASGDPGVNILPMAREGLRRELTTALHQTMTHHKPTTFRGLRVKSNGDTITVDLTVRPIGDNQPTSGYSDLFLVVLEEVPGGHPVPTGAEGNESAAAETDERIAALEHELRAKEEYLQSALEEMGTSNEELKSTNEEMQSVNEELQSTNEELETSKEELQSVNEELATVNSELQNKVVDLSRANNDMNNLLAGTGVGTLFLDHDLRIARFTPDVTQVINLIPTDIGRPLGHIVSNLVGYDSLVENVERVLSSLVPQEAEVQTKSGAWYLMRIRPYRTLENVIEGAVLTFVEITDRIQAEEALRKSQKKFAMAFRASADVLVISRCGDDKIVEVNENSVSRVRSPAARSDRPEHAGSGLLRGSGGSAARDQTDPRARIAPESPASTSSQVGRGLPGPCYRWRNWTSMTNPACSRSSVRSPSWATSRPPGKPESRPVETKENPLDLRETFNAAENGIPATLARFGGRRSSAIFETAPKQGWPPRGPLIWQRFHRRGPGSCSTSSGCTRSNWKCKTRKSCAGPSRTWSRRNRGTFASLSWPPWVTSPSTNPV